MKSIFFVLLIFCFATTYGQDSPAIPPLTISPELIEFNGGKYQGQTTTVDGSPDLVEDVIRQKFKDQGSKPDKVKGFLVFRKVMIPSVDPLYPVDAFVNVERKSRKEKEESVISWIVTRPGQISDKKLKSGTLPVGFSALTATSGFMSDLHPGVVKAVFDKDVADQEDGIRKAEKKYKDLLDDQASLEKKIKNLQEDLENNKKDQEKQAQEIERLKAALSGFLLRRPG